MDLEQIIEARAHLYGWVARPDVVPPVQDYGLHPDDVNPVSILTWTERDGQVLQGFLQWWVAKGYTGVAVSTQLTEPALVALREFTAGAWANPPTGTLPPPPVTIPPPSGPLPPPPPVVQPPPPAAETPKKGSTGWLWALGTAVLVVGGYALYAKPGRRGNPLFTSVDYEPVSRRAPQTYYFVEDKPFASREQADEHARLKGLRVISVRATNMREARERYRRYQ